MRLTTMIAIMAFAIAPAMGAISMAHEYSKHDVKILNDSVSALSSINPDLSAKLKAFTDREATMTRTEERQESSATQSEDVKTLRDSANALRAARPDLSKNLDSFAASEEKAWHQGAGNQAQPQQQQQRTPAPGY